MVSERFFLAKFILIVLAFYYSLFKRQFILCYIKWVSFCCRVYSVFLCETYILRFVDVKRIFWLKKHKIKKNATISKGIFNTQRGWYSRKSNVKCYAIYYFICAFHLACFLLKTYLLVAGVGEIPDYGVHKKNVSGQIYLGFLAINRK